MMEKITCQWLFPLVPCILYLAPCTLYLIPYTLRVYMLKKILLIIGLMILIALIKFALNRISPGSIVFHVNLLTGLQWFLFLGLVCWLVLQGIWRSARKKDFPFWLSWIFFLLIMAIGEWEV